MHYARIHVLAALLSGCCLVACDNAASDAEREAALRRAVELSASVTSLGVEEVRAGDGAEAVPGREVTVHYTGTLMEGTKFDSSRDRGQPYTFTLGQGDVIPGWDEGLEGMRVGGVRRLTIPASMAYGRRGSPPAIPPNAALRFEVELLGVE